MADLGRIPHHEEPEPDIRSRHLVDILIRRIIAEKRTVTVEEVADIIERMATAPFPTSALHLRKRIEQGQWTPSVTDAEYLTDLRLAIRHPGIRLVVYQRRGGAIAAMLTDTTTVLPETHLGHAFLPLLLAVYSADRGILLDIKSVRLATPAFLRTHYG